VALAIALATQALLLPIAAAGLSGSGVDMAFILERLPIAAMAIAFAYGLAVHTLWYAPLFALLLLVSAAVRRPILWIVVPVAAVQVLEKIAFGTNHSGEFIKYRLVGAMAEAFVPGTMRGPVTQLSQLDPVRFFTSPGLWLGLLAAAAFLYIAARVRRSKEALS
jgi:ABC-2 type transport system permease protein